MRYLPSTDEHQINRIRPKTLSPPSISLANLRGTGHIRSRTANRPLTEGEFEKCTMFNRADLLRLKLTEDALRLKVLVEIPYFRPAGIFEKVSLGKPI
jgi:hypothetical protein